MSVVLKASAEPVLHLRIDFKSVTTLTIITTKDEAEGWSDDDIFLFLFLLTKTQFFFFFLFEL